MSILEPSICFQGSPSQAVTRLPKKTRAPLTYKGHLKPLMPPLSHEEKGVIETLIPFSHILLMKSAGLKTWKATYKN